MTESKKKVAGYSFTLNALEFLLVGRPDELLDIRVGGEPESARTRWTRRAQGWLNNERLTPEERNRIRRVWIEGEYLAPLDIDGNRRRELDALLGIHNNRRAARPDAEQLQTALAGGTDV